MTTRKTKFPKVFKAKFIAALRSGKYNQTMGALCEIRRNRGTGELKKSGYCCLGVACTLVGIKDDEMQGYGIPGALSHAGNEKVKKLPKVLLDDTVVVDDLIALNDSGKSFKFIASYIEKNL